jgi:hypothetical protein
MLLTITIATLESLFSLETKLMLTLTSKLQTTVLTCLINIKTLQIPLPIMKELVKKSGINVEVKLITFLQEQELLVQLPVFLKN